MSTYKVSYGGGSVYAGRNYEMKMRALVAFTLGYRVGVATREGCKLVRTPEDLGMSSYQLIRNFETKDQLRLAVHNAENVVIDVSPCPDGIYTVSGPHGEPPHVWYAVVQVENGVVARVIS